MEEFKKITPEEKEYLEGLLYEAIFADDNPEKVEGGWVFTIQLQSIRFRVGMTDEELKAVIKCSVEIVEEMKTIWNSGITKEKFHEICEEEDKKAEGKEIFQQMAVVSRICTPTMSAIIEKLQKLMRVGGAYYMFISRPALMNVIYAVYGTLIEHVNDEYYCQAAVYFILRGIMKMNSEPVRDDAANE